MSQTPYPSPGDHAIFPPWHLPMWNAVDDRVRGGSSISHLDPIKVSLHSDSEKRKIVNGARFWGNLDIKTLGGAGFASQRHMFGPLPLHLPGLEYQGFRLSLYPDTALSSGSDHPRTFTLALKTTINTTPPSDPKTPPTPEPASLVYEANFTSPHAKSGTDEISIAFQDFKPMYRGKEVATDDPLYKPLISESIYEMSLMCRSGFGDQYGEFGIVLLGIAGWAKINEASRGQGWWEWLESMWGAVRSWVWGGRVKLEDEKRWPA
ncbi:MAG: hypothetical protein TREMPRED_004103 [Tremellales sp. Tagirdzhanova-0007]|nr:MAG: hypothetical protein TREMPRED_004103 [Tremellales sp. Tagirdzhanova-0007]